MCQKINYKTTHHLSVTDTEGLVYINPSPIYGPAMYAQAKGSDIVMFLIMSWLIIDHQPASPGIIISLYSNTASNQFTIYLNTYMKNLSIHTKELETIPLCCSPIFPFLIRAVSATTFSVVDLDILFYYSPHTFHEVVDLSLFCSSTYIPTRTSLHQWS